MDDLPKCMFKRWIRSFEEDTRDIQVFRPSDFDLPLTRAPRIGYEFRKNGEVIRLGSGPSDANTAVKGHFKKEGANNMILYFDDEDVKGVRIEILSCDESILKIKGST